MRERGISVREPFRLLQLGGGLGLLGTGWGIMPIWWPAADSVHQLGVSLR